MGVFATRDWQMGGEAPVTLAEETSSACMGTTGTTYLPPSREGGYVRVSSSKVTNICHLSPMTLSVCSPSHSLYNAHTQFAH